MVTKYLKKKPLRLVNNYEENHFHNKPTMFKQFIFVLVLWSFPKSVSNGGQATGPDLSTMLPSAISSAPLRFYLQ